jgi:hypothetical protein
MQAAVKKDKEEDDDKQAFEDIYYGMQRREHDQSGQKTVYVPTFCEPGN